MSKIRGVEESASCRPFQFFPPEVSSLLMSNILQKDIPRVKELCDLLGFRIGSDRPHFTLTDLTHTWRRQYVADDGTPGNELKEWRNPKTQDGLESMTMSYLGDQGYGEKLWPSKHSSHPDEFLEYRKNKAQ